MAKSVTEPISQAYERTVQMLFKPFDIKKWFVLGFAAFLSQLGEGGGGGGNNINIPTPGGGGGGGGGGFPVPPAPPMPPTPPFPTPGPGGFPAPPTPPTPPTFPQRPTPQEEFAQVLAQVKTFILNNLYWIIPVVIVAFAIGIVLIWLRARGKFIFLDGVANDRAAIVEPWKRLRREANSFFRFQLLLIVLVLLALAGSAAIVYLIALPDIQARQMGAGAIAAIVLGVVLLLGWSIFFGIANVIAEDFLIPVMYLRTTSIAPAWREFRANILPGNFWSIVLFYLMRIVLGIAMGIIMMLGMCVTCLIAALPYIGTVFFLPLLVFNRCYSLYFLRQFGPEYNLIVERMPALMSAFPVVMPPDAPVAPPGPIPTPAWPPPGQPPPPAPPVQQPPQPPSPPGDPPLGV
jgi:hypothetical protein